MPRVKGQAGKAFIPMLITPDENLKALGTKPLRPTEMMKVLWAYIKKNNLAKRENL